MTGQVVPFRKPPKKKPEKPARKPSGSQGGGRSKWTMPIVWALILALLVVAYAVKGGFTASADAAPRLDGALAPAAAIRITDGDTFRIGEERIRIANIDTPEMPGRAKCEAEAEAALAAKARLRELLSDGEIRVLRDGVDRYGRTLATVSVDGADVGEQLIREGAAQRWAGRRAQWCGA